MYKSIEFSVKGESPLMTHNGRISTNPMHPLTRQIRSFTGKRTKTEEDFLAISKLEWMSGLYLLKNPDIEVKGTQITFIGGSTPTLISDGIEAAIIAGAKKNKLGVQFKSGLLVPEDAPIIYEGSIIPEEMWNSGQFLDVRPVRVQKNAVMRSRPIFMDWAVSFTVNYLPSIINPDQIHEALEIAGSTVGWFEYRPKFGRFRVI